MSGIVTLVLVSSVASVVPSVLYLAPGGARAASWGARPLAAEQVGTGAYRSAPRVAWASRRAPWIVRIAALTCFYLGQLGPPAGVVGVAALLIGVQSLTDGLAHRPFATPLVDWVVLGACLGGVWVGLCLLSAGWSLLTRDISAPDKARRAARWSCGYGVALLAGLSVAWHFDPRELELALGLLGFAIATIAQAALLPPAARALMEATRAPMPPPGTLPSDG